MVSKKDFNVKHVGKTYEINEFLKNHPGGVNYIKPYKEKDVTKRMVDTQHSNAAFYLLREYKVGGRNESTTEFNEDLEVSVQFVLKLHWRRKKRSQTFCKAKIYSNHLYIHTVASNRSN